MVGSDNRKWFALGLILAVQFMTILDIAIVNVALPTIQADLHFADRNLQWVITAYGLTYGGFLLLGGRASDLIGRRIMFMIGLALFGAASLVCGLSTSSAMLVVARGVQGLGAAIVTPAALSIISVTFTEGSERNKALGAWGAVAGLASGLGVFLGGVITEAIDWRWVFFVNLPVCLVVLRALFRLIPADGPRRVANLDVGGAVLVTGGMLLLIYTLVKAPDVGWGETRTIAGFAGAGLILAAFALYELRQRNPLFPFSILRIPGLAAADVTQMIAMAGFYSMFFFMTLYIQNVLHFSKIGAGAAYVPATLSVAISAGISTRLIAGRGTRPVIAAGALLGAGGIYWLSHIPVDGTYLSNILPALVVLSLGLGAVFVGVTTAAQAGVPADKAGLAAALINSSTWLGGALGIAIFSALATSRTRDLLADHATQGQALTGGVQRALLAAAIFLAAAAVIALRAPNTHGEEEEAETAAGAAADPLPETA